jgi:hypothetical protein
LFLVLCALLFAPCSQATELTDLGSGLAYLRIHSLTDSEAALRKVVPEAGALVLDLRYTTANDGSAAILRAALAGHSAGAPLFILVSPATPAALDAVIRRSPALTLGAPGSVPAPDVVVQTAAAADRRAYDALDTGSALEKLISGRVEKERFDEATLVQEFKDGNPDPAPPQTPDPTAPKSVEDLAKVPPVPLTDRVLQRAVHLHRALLALKPSS